MSAIIALVWDFDKTLVDGYMQDPIFEHYQVDPQQFWRECDKAIDYYSSQDLWVNRDTFYLNCFLRAIKKGQFPGLNNQKLFELGAQIKFYPGIEELFVKLKAQINNNAQYQAFDLKLEHYIISSGFRKMIQGCKLAQYCEFIWGCELLEDEQQQLSEIGYTIDNTTKTRALFEINKGVHSQDRTIDVNTQIPKEDRRVQFENLVYIADGPSDIPAFSVVKHQHGSTFAVYQPGHLQALQQVDKMARDERIDAYAEANYLPNTQAAMWLSLKIDTIARQIIEQKRHTMSKYSAGTPAHLN